MYHTGIIIGFGNSGERFLQACRLSADTQGTITVTAVVDRNGRALQRARQEGIMAYDSIDEALAKGSYDVAFVCTNDAEHFSVLASIHRHPGRVRRIVCEKPLTERWCDAEMLAEKFEDREIAVSFVERFSPITRRMKQWMLERQLRVTRASFTWGKCRLSDYRPTIGVLSEVSHPIDLFM